MLSQAVLDDIISEVKSQLASSSGLKRGAIEQLLKTAPSTQGLCDLGVVKELLYKGQGRA